MRSSGTSPAATYCPRIASVTVTTHAVARRYSQRFAACGRTACAMCRVLTRGRGIEVRRLATAASQCSLPRWTWTTSTSRKRRASRRTSATSAAGVSPLANPNVSIRSTPSRRAGPITRVSVPSRQPSVTTCPRRSSSRVIRAAQ